jgi:hypothetical protein
MWYRTVKQNPESTAYILDCALQAFLPKLNYVAELQKL